MSSEHHARIKEIFVEASRREPADRTAFLDDACGGDDALRREVESLLAYHDDDDFGGGESAVDATTR